MSKKLFSGTVLVCYCKFDNLARVTRIRPMYNSIVRYELFKNIYFDAIFYQLCFFFFFFSFGMINSSLVSWVV